MPGPPPGTPTPPVGHWTPVETDRPITRVIDARSDRLAGVLMDSLRVQTLGIFGRVR